MLTTRSHNGSVRGSNPRLARAIVGAVAICVATAMLWPAFGGTVAADAAVTAADLPQEQVAAIGEAGTVYLSGTWSGFVNFPRPDGSSAWSNEVDASFSCSGFIASSDGYVVTAGHCADPAEGRTSLVDQFLSDEVANGDITEADAQAYLAAGAEENWPVEGAQSGEPPVLAMKVYPAITITADDSQSFDAVLVDDRPIGQGDSALFKIDARSPLPVLLVSPNAPSTGQTVDAIGYPGNVSGLVSGNPEPTFAQGQVSGRQQTSGGPFTQIGVAMSPGMSGGPVVNTSGDVVGTVSFGPSSDTQQLNFATAPETISAILARNGVSNELSDLDALFRKGLNEYFTGHFHDAAADLGTVTTRDPANAIAQQYQTKAIASFPQENTTGWVVWVIIGAALFFIIVIVVVILLVVLLRSRRRKLADAPPVALAADPNAPAPASASAPASTPEQAPLPAPFAGPVPSGMTQPVPMDPAQGPSDQEVH
ncbi:S1 family peptidase [Subtercola frigoramans]|uniref:S1-C subfamily serine protease n=1 Tax=Subtercola frigoramans TaxID=120298 RepID=A0ABS2L4E8_9MICO|nr:serine protease [Subtercola frigoramans]MBM7471972.1 S1-C subfamily serine protease [Subtercola frigoramans]